MSRRSRCTCRVSQAGDLDVARGHAEVGDLTVCVGHTALANIRQLIRSRTMTDNATTHETGAYEGSPNKELMDRIRRMETRANAFYRRAGYVPNEVTPERTVLCIAKDGALHATGFDITIGEINVAAQRARLRGTVALYVGGVYWGEVRV